MALIYLAGPIDGVSQVEAGSWREDVSEVLKEAGHAAFLPNAPWRVRGADLESYASLIDAVNRSAMRWCAGVIANLCGPGRGIGTIREIEYAARNINRPVLVFLPILAGTAVAVHDVTVVKIDNWDSIRQHSTLYPMISDWLDGVEVAGVS